MAHSCDREIDGRDLPLLRNSRGVKKSTECQEEAKIEAGDRAKAWATPFSTLLPKVPVKTQPPTILSRYQQKRWFGKQDRYSRGLSNLKSQIVRETRRVVKELNQRKWAAKITSRTLGLQYHKICWKAKINY